MSKSSTMYYDIEGEVVQVDYPKNMTISRDEARRLKERVETLYPHLLTVRVALNTNNFTDSLK